MPPVILSIIGVMFLTLIGWTWTNLGNIETKTKLMTMIIGFVIVYVITFIIFNVSKIGITYESKDVMISIRNVFVMLFTIINSYVLLPFIFKKLNQINNEEIDKDIFQKSILIVLILIVILFIFESIYFGNIQEEILAMR